MVHDKHVESERYDARARFQLAGAPIETEAPLGSRTMATYLRTPYLVYEREITELLTPRHRVLELGAGVGAHTRALLDTGAQVVASDISVHSVRLLSKRFPSASNLETAVADMECLPFDARSFDAVVCAGSLSYGAPTLVDSEIRRVLRPGGALVCVDSLDHSPIYRLNRWVQYVRGKRTRSTLTYMPNLRRLNAMGTGFCEVSVQFFGALSFAMPLIARLAGQENAQIVSDRMDALIGTRRSAFKFVLVAQRFAATAT